ncbi:sensor histidine kinase [Aeromicrobium piscarium]|uniref:Sensor-like histidine kinase SenX3 n=1 Tax=Aeromicrobium piscarium TaxID=2590901 RepID=A0A554S7K3_9ACTN|nr:ATP-binding protein [Aeromicrobium piscarium]TSD62332.1 hypothetical protein FNM00_11895 [Aeromicrobium piscarium]
MANVNTAPSWHAPHAGFIRVLVGLFTVAALVVIAMTLAYPGPDPHTIVLVSAGISLVALNIVAFTLPWGRLPRRHTFWLALAQLVITILLAGTLYQTNNAIPLLALIPVLWIAFQLDWPHTIAIIVALGLGCIAFWLIVEPMPSRPRVIVAISVFYFVVASLAILTQANADALRRSRAIAEEAWRSQQDALASAESNAAVMRAIAHGVDAAVFFASQDRSSTFANQRAQELGRRMGVSAQDPTWAGHEVYGPDRVTPIPPEDQLLPRALQGEYATESLQWVGEPGAQHAVSVSSLPAVTEAGEQVGAVIVAHDITNLVEALHAAESFSATVAHELRTPLTSIVGYLDLLETDDLDETGREFLRRAQQGVTSLSAKLRELLEPFEVAGASPTFSFIDVVDLLRRRVNHWRESAGTRGIVIEGPDGSSRLQVPLDRELAERMVDAVLSNAVKFSASGGRIEVAVDTHENSARITVTDHGLGMTREETRHAFERFYRAPTAIRRALPGFGLGLATALSIAQAHGGTIRLESAAGAGTTAIVEISLTQVGVAARGSS